MVIGLSYTFHMNFSKSLNLVGRYGDIKVNMIFITYQKPFFSETIRGIKLKLYKHVNDNNFPIKCVF